MKNNVRYTRMYALNTGVGVRYIRRRIGKRRTKPNFVGLAILTGSLLGNLYLMKLGPQTINFLDSHVAAQELSTELTPVASPPVGEVTAQNDAGQSASPPASPKPQRQEIIEYIVEVFGEEAPNAFNVLYCENRGLNPEAVNHNRNGTTDHSIFQINSIHAKRFGEAFKTDWKANVDVAKQIYDEQGWTPWTCSHRVDVKSYLYQ